MEVVAGAGVITVSNIKFEGAVDLLRKLDTRMVKQNYGGRTQYFIIPGGPVDDQLAQRIKEHPLVRGGKDGLFQGHEQYLADPIMSFAKAAEGRR
jgi:hypothetical protein